MGFYSTLFQLWTVVTPVVTHIVYCKKKCVQRKQSRDSSPKQTLLPRARMREQGVMWSVVVSIIYYILYIIYIYLQGLFFYLSKYSLSDAHFSTGRLLFEFNRLQYTLAAPEVFVSSANPVILPSGYRVSIVRNTNIYQIETTPLLYC